RFMGASVEIGHDRRSGSLVLFSNSRLQGMQIIDCPLRMGDGLEDGALVISQHRKPACEVGSVIRAWLEFGDDTEIGTQQGRPNLSNEFLPSPLRPIFGIATKIAADAVRFRRPMNMLVAEDRDIGRRIPEGFEG